MSLADCRLIDFAIVHDPRGNLTLIEGEHHVPFEINRGYYVYDVPGGRVARTKSSPKGVERATTAAPEKNSGGWSNGRSTAPKAKAGEKC